MALMGCLLATAVQTSRQMSSTVWIFALDDSHLTFTIPRGVVSRYRSILYNTVVLAARGLSVVFRKTHLSPPWNQSFARVLSAYSDFKHGLLVLLGHKRTF
jgi:hypothetical protein